MQVSQFCPSFFRLHFRTRSVYRNTTAMGISKLKYSVRYFLTTDIGVIFSPSHWCGRAPPSGRTMKRTATPSAVAPSSCRGGRPSTLGGKGGAKYMMANL